MLGWSVGRAPEDGALVHGPHRPLVDAQPAALARRTKGAGLPPPPRHLFLGYLKVDDPPLDVDQDRVALLDKGQRPTRRRLGRGLGHDEAAVDEARYLAFRDHGDIVDQ